jgi:hypothetical protein
MTTNEFDLPPSNDYLEIGKTLLVSPPLSVQVLPQCLVLNLGGGEIAVVRCDLWEPQQPQHDNPNEECRLHHLWCRVRRWVGLTGQQLLEKFNRRDLADCSGELVANLDALREPSYTPPNCDDTKRWMPRCPDRLDVTKQPELQARIVAAKIDRDISEFFRPADQLGAGNDEKRAMEDFERQFAYDKELFAVLNSPVPHVPSPSELAKKTGGGGGGGGDSSGQNIGGRGLPH